MRRVVVELSKNYQIDAGINGLAVHKPLKPQWFAAIAGAALQKSPEFRAAEGGRWSATAGDLTNSTFSFIITVGYGYHGYSRPPGTGNTRPKDQSREESRDLVFERSKAVTPDQMEVLEILGKSDQSGHRMPIRMSKTTGFPGRTRLLMRKGGWQGGSKMQNPRGKRGSKWSKPV